MRRRLINRLCGSRHWSGRRLVAGARELPVIALTLLVAAAVGLGYLQLSGLQLISAHRAGPAMAWHAGDGLLVSRSQASRAAPLAPAGVSGYVTAVLPGLGRLLDWLSRPLGLIASVYLPCAAVMWHEYVGLRRHLSHPRYQLFPGQ